jgi:hypothetical protein
LDWLQAIGKEVERPTVFLVFWKRHSTLQDIWDMHYILFTYAVNMDVGQ